MRLRCLLCTISRRPSPLVADFGCWTAGCEADFGAVVRTHLCFFLWQATLKRSFMTTTDVIVYISTFINYIIIVI